VRRLVLNVITVGIEEPFGQQVIGAVIHLDDDAARRAVQGSALRNAAIWALKQRILKNQTSTKRTSLGEVFMPNIVSMPTANDAPPPDQPYLDSTAYGAGPNDSVVDASKNVAITHHAATVGGAAIPYSARVSGPIPAQVSVHPSPISSRISSSPPRKQCPREAPCAHGLAASVTAQHYRRPRLSGITRRHDATHYDTLNRTKRVTDAGRGSDS